MGDKYRSDIPKPVNNPLLSGAGHGFPFDTFQGSSLLVPVSQESSAVLSEHAEPDKFVGQDVGPVLTDVRLNEPVNVSVEAKTEVPTVVASPPEQQQQQSGPSYVRLFNAFFGGGQAKQEPEPPRQDRGSDHPSAGSTPRSFSPYVHLPNFQTVTPALQVPGSTGSTDAFPPTQQQQPSEGIQSGPPYPPYPSNQPPPPNMFAQQKPPEGRPKMAQPYPPLQQQKSEVYDASKPPAMPNPNAPPPLFRGDSSKTYRLCHNKRPVYAPIPGLTLSTASSAPFVQQGPQDVPSVQPSVYSPPIGQPLLPSAGAGPVPVPMSQSTPAGPGPTTPTVASFFGGSSRDSFSTGFGQSQSVHQPPPPVQSVPPTVQSFPGPPPSVQSAPIQPSPVQTAMVQPSPVQVAPVQPSPVQTAPIQPTPIQTAPIQPSPVQMAPIQPSPVQPSPVQVSPPQPGPPTSLPYPATSAAGDKQSLFAPISKATVNPPEVNPPVTVFNPVAVHPVPDKMPSPVVVPPSLNHLAHVGRTGTVYRPPYHHWFYKQDKDSKNVWRPFSMTDSVALEQSFQSGKIDENTVIATDGGRYDVSIMKRTRSAVYWDEAPSEVRRCSWFYKNNTERRYRPYDEATSYHLEEEYKKCVTTDSWRKRVDLLSTPDEYVIMYSTTNIAHFEGNFPMPDEWEGDFSDGSHVLSAKMVKRGISDEFDIEDGEAPRIDHLVFVVHGIGRVCDLKLRTIEESGTGYEKTAAEDDGDGDDWASMGGLLSAKGEPLFFAVDVFRSISHKLIHAHYGESLKSGLVNRIEILPISWHSHLHGETTGLDKKMEKITLKSIPRLRNFTNDTLLDILFYTSPVYCQNIVQTVGREINTIYEKFKKRNPNFSGGVSLVGHSLGSLILFDMLCHQKPPPEPGLDVNKLESKLTRRMSGFVVGNASETRQPYIEYPQFPFQPVAFFAMGSPIGMFITVRGIDQLGEDFNLPTCLRFFNIFHPIDPLAYRIEPHINPTLSEKRPVLIPHHKGRKRMHLELKETLTRVGADLKQRLVDSIRSTWNTVYQLTAFGRADDGLEQEVDKVIQKHLAGSEGVAACLQEDSSPQPSVGKLNMGRRIDYVLQEAPLESFNEYVAAVRGHFIYWDSEDTILMIMRELYSAEGITSDSEVYSEPDSVSSEIPSPSTLAGVGWNIGMPAAPSSTTDPTKTRTKPAPPTTLGLDAPGYGFINN